MTYYNAIVYTDYGTYVTYNDITNLSGFLVYVKNNISYTKIFLYRKPYRKAEKGLYCAYNFPNMPDFKFK